MIYGHVKSHSKITKKKRESKIEKMGYNLYGIYEWDL
jgi:hypothetical protein